MLYDIAILPEVFDHINLSSEEKVIEFVGFLRDVKTSAGTVADLEEGEWLEAVKERVPLLPPALRHYVKSWLTTLDKQNRLRWRRRTSPAQSSSISAWIRRAIASASQLDLDFILHCDGPRQHAALPHPHTRFLWGFSDSEEWEDARSESIALRKIPREFRPWLSRLLRYATTLKIVDRHLHPDKRAYAGTVKWCASDLGLGLPARPNGSIVIHVPLRKPGEEGSSSEEQLLRSLFGSWERLLRPIVRGGCPHSFKICVWRHVMHDRCLITNLFSVGPPYGTDPTDWLHDEWTTWNLLNRKLRERVLRQYKPEYNYPQLVGILKGGGKTHRFERFPR